jgi:hypothetical protein
VSPAGTWLEGVGDGTGTAATFLACNVGFEAVGLYRNVGFGGVSSGVAKITSGNFI